MILLCNCLGDFNVIEDDLVDYESVSSDDGNDSFDNGIYFGEEDLVENDLNMRRVTINTAQSSPKSLRRKLKKIRKQTARLFDNLDRSLDNLDDLQDDEEMYDNCYSVYK